MSSFLSSLRLARAPTAAFVSMGLVWGGFMAVMPDLRAGLGVADGTLGLMLIAGTLGALASMLAAPRFGARLGRGALPGLSAAMGLAVVAMGFVAQPAHFVLVLVAMGLATGALEIFTNARLAAIEARSGRALMNLSHGLYSAAFALAAVAVGGARAAGLPLWAIFAAIAALVALLALAAREHDGVVEGLAPGPRKGRARLGPVPLIGGVLVLVGLMGENAVEAWSALYIERDLGAAVGAGSLAPAMMAVTMTLGRLSGQALTARHSERALLGGGLAIAALGMAGVIAAPGMLWAYAGFLVFGLGTSVVVPTAMSLVGRLSAPETRGRAVARATVIGYVGYFVGPPLLGLAAQAAGLRLAFGLVALFLLAALAVSRRLGRFG